jgi:hypothetical protein
MNFRCLLMRGGAGVLGFVPLAYERLFLVLSNVLASGSLQEQALAMQIFCGGLTSECASEEDLRKKGGSWKPLCLRHSNSRS